VKLFENYDLCNINTQKATWRKFQIISTYKKCGNLKFTILRDIK